MQQQKKLEIVIPFERMQRTLATWTELDKLWLVDMKETGVIREFRCKERDDR